MSDRVAIEVKFKEFLADYRTSCLSLIASSYDELSKVDGIYSCNKLDKVKEHGNLRILVSHGNCVNYEI